MAIIRRVMHIPLDQISVQNSGYSQAKARFEEILTTRLGVTQGSTASLALSASGETQEVSTVTPQIAPKPNLEQVTTDVRTGSGDSLEQINQVLTGTPMAGLGAAFKAAENTYGVNAYFLSALAAHESDFGRSSIAEDKKNLFGFTAYDSNPYGSARQYGSVEESIFDAASYLSEQYLTPGGKYYKGTGIKDIGQSYATDPQWSEKVIKHLNNQLNPK